MIARVALRPYQLPFAHPVRGETLRRGWLLRLEDRDGRAGWGDAACWPGFGAGPRRTHQHLVQLESASFPAELDHDAIAAWQPTWRAAAPEARHAGESALLDLLGQQRGRPLAELLAPRPRARVALQALVPDLAPARVAWGEGIRCLKLKVGPDPAQDLPRVRALREALGPGLRLRLDANGSYRAGPDLERALAAFAELGVEWIEQPLPAGFLRETARLRRRSPLPILLDESVAGLPALEAAIAAEAADGVVIKAMVLGGPLSALRCARRARAAGLRVLVTHFLESAIGRTAALHLAAALPGEPSPAGLADPLARDLAPAPGREGGQLLVPTAPGLGLRPHPVPGKEVA